VSKVRIGLPPALALAVLLTGAAAGPATAKSGPRITRPVRVTTGDAVPTRTYSSPSLAVDPEDDQTVVASYAEMRSASCGMARSRDGGRTWARLAAPVSPPSHPFCFIPLGANVYFSPVTFGRDHVLYVAMGGWDVQDGRTNSVLLARSTDLGDSWSITIVHDARGKPEADAEVNRPVSSVAVDTTGPIDVVYVGWTLTKPNARPPTPAMAAIATSTDAGRTFGPPVSVVGTYFDDLAARMKVLADRPTVYPPGVPPPPPPDTFAADRFGGGGTRVVLGAADTVYALWFPSAAGTPVNPALNLSRSTDGGRTFEVTQAVPPTRGLGSPVLAWSPQGGPDGTLHLVYELKVPLAQGDRDITYQRSTDGGRTWTAPRIVNDEDPTLLTLQFMPNISVAPNGRVDIAWWDFRNDPGTFQNDVYLASSSDNGMTWSPNRRVTDRSIDRKIGPWSNGYDVRQPPGLAPTTRYTIVAWDDTRNGDPDAQAQDIYGSFVQFQELAAATPLALTYALAAVAGLGLAGVVVSATAFGIRRRAGARNPDPAGVPTSDAFDRI
jgi:hypothetical protein